MLHIRVRKPQVRDNPEVTWDSEEEVPQVADPEKPHTEADTNLATHERPHSKAAGDAMKESAAHWEPILLYFQFAINQINFP